MTHSEVGQHRSLQHNDARILVKRKRDDDPVVALVFENKRRRGGGTGQFYYKFSQTGGESLVEEPPLEQAYLEAINSDGRPTYVTSRKSKAATKGVSDINKAHAELEQMALQYLKLDRAEETREEDFVWDIYLKEQLPDERELGGTVGYILDESDLEDKGLEVASLSDDADDSNAEDYYANDYPDDLDAEQYSVSGLESDAGESSDHVDED